MQESSLYTLSRRLGAETIHLLSNVDVYELDLRPRQLIGSLKVQIGDIRLDARDYELSDTKHEQHIYAVAMRARLADLRDNVLAISEYGIFGSVDVIQISTHIDNILDCLE